MSTLVNIAELAALLRVKRGKRGLRSTAEEIGGVSASTLSRVEQGKLPDLETFLRLCQWLDVSPKRFMLDDDTARDVSHRLQDEDEQPSTLEVVTAHLRADRTLDPETAKALATMIRLAYEAAHRGDFGGRT